MFTQANDNLYHLEFIRKHLLDDHFDFFPDNNYQNPITTFPTNDWSFVQNSDESTQDISKFCMTFCSSNSTASSPSSSLVSLHDQIIDDNNLKVINTSQQTFQDTSFDFSDSPSIYGETQQQFSPVTFPNLNSAIDNSFNEAPNKPLKLDFSTGNVVAYVDKDPVVTVCWISKAKDQPHTIKLTY